MLKLYFFFLLLLLSSSCSLFKGQDLQHKKIEDLISYLKVEGEGRGRLGISQQQYLFSFESVLKNKQDWVLAANIPLHGEEVLILPNLKNEKIVSSEEGRLELRIEQGISDYLKSKKQSPQLAKVFILELRRIMRLALHKELGLKLKCSSQECHMGDVVYEVEASSEQLLLKKSVTKDYQIEFSAMNLTDSIFKRSNVFLHSKNKTSNTPPLLSLELFWK